MLIYSEYYKLGCSGVPGRTVLEGMTDGVIDEQCDRLPSVELGLKEEIKKIKGDIMAVKKGVPKGDKKAKKEAQGRIDELEALLALKQAQLSSGTVGQQEEAEPVQLYVEREKGKREEKRQRRAAAGAAKVEAARASKPKGPDPSVLEQQRLEPILSAAGLEIYDIEPDGHCLFAAIAHQLADGSSYQDIRRIAADHILAHADFYEAFMDDEEERGEENDRIDGYCERVRSTTLWGGEMELDAIAKGLGRRIRVFQADGEPLLFSGDNNGDNGDEPLNLCFQRHAYTLGNHYDSLVPRQP